MISSRDTHMRHWASEKERASVCLVFGCHPIEQCIHAHMALRMPLIQWKKDTRALPLMHTDDEFLVSTQITKMTFIALSIDRNWNGIDLISAYLNQRYYIIHFRQCLVLYSFFDYFFSVKVLPLILIVSFCCCKMWKNFYQKKNVKKLNQIQKQKKITSNQTKKKRETTDTTKNG